jgi:hypothetical protein
MTQDQLELIELKEALDRAAFVLYKIANGDPKALENAADVAGDSVALLRKLGHEYEWMENYDEEFGD